MGSFLMERIFRSTPNGVLTAHTEWLPGVRLRHSVPPVQYIQRIVRVGGCPAVVAQWQSTGGSSQRCPGFNSRQLPAFFTFFYFCLITSKFIYHGEYSNQSLIMVVEQKRKKEYEKWGNLEWKLDFGTCCSRKFCSKSETMFVWEAHLYTVKASKSYLTSFCILSAQPINYCGCKNWQVG